MSFVLLGILNSQASGAAQAYFLSVLGGADEDIGNSVALDSDDNAYVLGQTRSAGQGDRDFLLAKYDSIGSVQWQRTLGNNTEVVGEGVAVDSANNVYVVGKADFGANFILAKYNSSGAIQWQRLLTATFEQNSGQSVAIDSADNVYVCGFTTGDGQGGQDLLLAKYNSSGAIQWQRTFGGNFGDQGKSVAIDSADNVYVFGDTKSIGSDIIQDFILAKYNSSGAIQWQRVLGGDGFDSGHSVALDSSDNVYVLGFTNSTGAGNLDFLLAKYDSSGSIQWQRVLGGASNDLGFSVAIDSADNVYVLGAGGNDFLLAKYNSAGTIQFQRVLGGSGGESGESVVIDSADNVYVLGSTSSTGAGSQDFLLAKLPNDGSLEGTYLLDGNNIIYQASSLTSATASLTAATSSLTSATSSLTESASTLTDASASLTVVTEEIG